MLFRTPELQVAEERVLLEIEDLKRRLRHQLHEPRRWAGSLRRLSFARAIQGSNTIEGYVASLDDAAAVAAGEDPLDAGADTRRALQGYRDAMTYVLQLSTEPDFSYDERLLKSLHFMISGYDLETRPGAYRVGPALVYNSEAGEVVYEGPDVDLAPALMRELVDGLNGDIAVPAIVRAGMSHLNLVMIHPFRDGNGRMARALQSLVLAREGFLSPVFMSIEEHLGRNTQAYYDVLALVGGGSWNPGNDARPWLRFTLAAHWLQARRVLRRARESERLWDMLERIAEERRLPERSLPALLDAVVGLRLRNATYRAIVEEVESITDATASRDLAKLVDADALEARGERRGRSYVRGPLLSAAWAEITDARDQADEPGPFADAPD